MREEWCGYIQKKADGSEIVNYNDESFPSYIHDGHIRVRSTWGNVTHYHTEIELISVYKGHMGMNVNGKSVLLNEGDSIWVNSEQIHYSFTDMEEKCRYALAIIHPNILCSSARVKEDFVDPIINNGAIPYLYFKAGTELAEEIQQTAFRLVENQCNHFQITREFFNLWNLILSHCEEHLSTDDEIYSDPSLFCMKKMLCFCQNNYDKDIKLADIATYAGVSNTYCNQLFHKYARQTPLEALTRIRMERASDLLLHTNLTMSEIAEKTGFSGASYFAEVFKRNYHTSPRNYRKEMEDERSRPVAKR